MKHLEDALLQRKHEESKPFPNHYRHKSKTQLQRWRLDPDVVQESPQEVRERLTLVISSVLQKKFQCEKYLEEETFRDLLRDLITLLPHYSSELEKLTKIEEMLQSLPDSSSAEHKNYIKQFQSLLDAKIRKLKKRGKRAQLVEFDRLMASEAQMHRKNEVCYINEEEKGLKYTKHLRRRQSNLNTSQRSFGTMNSASNQNESGSAKNQSGSGSKSGESKALAVLLANIDAQEERKGKKEKQREKEKYEFTSILSATLNIRQRHNNNSRTPIFTEHPSQEESSAAQKELTPDEQDKDEAFIFHHPKRSRHNKQ